MNNPNKVPYYFQSIVGTGSAQETLFNKVEAIALSYGRITTRTVSPDLTTMTIVYQWPTNEAYIKYHSENCDIISEAEEYPLAYNKANNITFAGVYTKG